MLKMRSHLNPSLTLYLGMISMLSHPSLSHQMSSSCLTMFGIFTFPK